LDVNFIIKLSELSMQITFTDEHYAMCMLYWNGFDLLNSYILLTFLCSVLICRIFPVC